MTHRSFELLLRSSMLIKVKHSKCICTLCSSCLQATAWFRERRHHTVPLIFGRVRRQNWFGVIEADCMCSAHCVFPMPYPISLLAFSTVTYNIFWGIMLCFMLFNPFQSLSRGSKQDIGTQHPNYFLTCSFTINLFIVWKFTHVSIVLETT